MEIVICDDDKKYVKKFWNEKLIKVLKEVNIEANISFFTDGNLLINEFNQFKLYDIVILDIDMPSINGKDLAKKLRSISSAFRLVFISSFNNEVYNTLQYTVDAFIPKDSPEEFFMTEIKRVIRKAMDFKPEYQIINVKEIIDGKYGEFQTSKFLLQDIYYISCKVKKCYLYTVNKEFLLPDDKYEALAQAYIPLGFFEVVRGLIVNLRHISSVNDIDIILDNSAVVPLTRRRKKPLLDEISNMITKEVVFDEV